MFKNTLVRAALRWFLNMEDTRARNLEGHMLGIPQPIQVQHRGRCDEKGLGDNQART